MIIRIDGGLTLREVNESLTGNRPALGNFGLRTSEDEIRRESECLDPVSAQPVAGGRDFLAVGTAVLLLTEHEVAPVHPALVRHCDIVLDGGRHVLHRICHRLSGRKLAPVTEILEEAAAAVETDGRKLDGIAALHKDRSKQICLVARDRDLRKVHVHIDVDIPSGAVDGHVADAGTRPHGHLVSSTEAGSRQKGDNGHQYYCGNVLFHDHSSFSRTDKRY